MNQDQKTLRVKKNLKNRSQSKESACILGFNGLENFKSFVICLVNRQYNFLNWSKNLFLLLNAKNNQNTKTIATHHLFVV